MIECSIYFIVTTHNNKRSVIHKHVVVIAHVSMAVVGVISAEPILIPLKDL